MSEGDIDMHYDFEKNRWQVTVITDHGEYSRYGDTLSEAVMSVCQLVRRSQRNARNAAMGQTV